MAKVRLKIPEQITGFIRFPLGEMESELLGVYQRGVLTSENASVIAGMECWQFNKASYLRKIPALYRK